MKRIEWIDSLKGFGMVCVSLGHLCCGLLLERYIYSFHMFLFFFISGYLHSNTKTRFSAYLSKKTKTLFIPFLFWNTASSAVSFLFHTPFRESIRQFLVLDGEMCWNIPIWFLLLLYMVEIVFFGIEKYIPKGKHYLIPFLYLYWLFIPNRNIFFKLNILPVCLLFYLLGNTFRNHSETYFGKSESKSKSILFALLFLSISILFGVFLNKRISFNGADFGNVFYCSLAAFSGVSFYILIFRKIRILGTNKILTYIGRNSLIIMATQYWFVTFFNILWQILFQTELWQYRSTSRACVLTFINILLVYVIVEILKKISFKSPMLKKICIMSGISMK